MIWEQFWRGNAGLGTFIGLEDRRDVRLLGCCCRNCPTQRFDASCQEATSEPTMHALC